MSIEKRISRPNSELAVISSCLNKIDKGWISHVAIVGGENVEEIFFDKRNRAIFSTIRNIISQDKIPTIASVIDRLDDQYSSLFEDGSEEYIEHVRLTPMISDIDQLDSVIFELDQIRSMRNQIGGMEHLLSDIADDKVDPNPEDIATRLQEIVDNTNIRTNTQTFSEIVQEVIDSPRPMWAQTTGIPEIDDVLGGHGFESGCLTIIAARPKVGKTALMNTFIHNTVDGGAYPLVLNYETKKVEFVAKMIARYVADEDLGWPLVKGYLSKEEGLKYTATQERQIKDGLDWAMKQNWYVSFDKSMGMPEIQSLVIKTKAELPDNAKVVLFVDYLQLQVKSAHTEREEITQLTRFYKKMAGELDISVVCLSQLNREGKNDRPSVHHLRGSGSIEQDADTIVLLDSPRRTDPEAPKYILNVYAGTTRLSAGDDFDLFIDGSTNLVTTMPDDKRDMTDELS